jgi:hypothetical protein
MSFVPAKCPSCSAIIQVPADRERAVCMFCGTSLMTQAAISFLGGPNPKDTLTVALQLLTARDFKQADEQLNRVLEYNPKHPDAWAAKAYISLNPDISSVKSDSDLCSRILAAFRQGELYLQNALEVPSFDEKIAKSIGALFVENADSRNGYDHPDGNLACHGLMLISIDMPEGFKRYSEEGLKRCSEAWDLVSALCLRAAYEICPDMDIRRKVHWAHRDCERMKYAEIQRITKDCIAPIMDVFDKNYPGWRTEQEAIDNANRELAEKREKEKREKEEEQRHLAPKPSFWNLLFGS